jgi:hypothetical protein
MSQHEPSKFLKQLAPQIIAELKPPKELKKFANNSDIIGDYVEAGVRQFVRRYLSPIRVSTGGVIDQSQSPGSPIDQLDTIAWIPGPVAAVFEIGDFGLVLRSSCLGILEIKSSAYTGAVEKLDERTGRAFVDPITAELDERGMEGELNSWFDTRCFGMGIISLLQENQRGNTRLKQLREEEKVAVMFEEIGEEFQPQADDIYRLVNFLAILRFRASRRDGRVGINLQALK